MTSRTTLRTLGALLVVAFMLLTIWSLYSFYSDTRAAGTTTTHTVASYESVGNGTFVAALVPNDLCNCTQVTGGNTTLFASITRTVNVTMASTVGMTAPGTIQWLDEFSVVLSTPAWAKPVYVSQNISSAIPGAETTVAEEYTINVSYVENLTTTIDTQLNYTAPYATLELTSLVVATVAVGGSSSQTLVVSPSANFTFESSTIATGFLPSTARGNLTSLPAADGPVPVSAYLTVAVAATLLAVSTIWFASVNSRPGEYDLEPVPDLDEMIAPYEEAIAETATVPDPAATIPIDRWEDLVKVSDTLGKPILRPLVGPAPGPRNAFYVLDGDVGYLFRYEPGAVVPSPRPPEPPLSELPGGGAQLLERVRLVAARVEALPPGDPRLAKALARFRRVRALLGARRWVEAERTLADLERLVPAV